MSDQTEFTPDPRTGIKKGDIFLTWCSRSWGQEYHRFQPGEEIPLICLCEKCEEERAKKEAQNGNAKSNQRS